MGYKLKVSLVQTDIHWENVALNLDHIEEKLAKLANETDIVVLPEMFTTGFSMNAQYLAENISDITVSTIKRWAKDYNLAIVGSFIAEENNQYYNKGFFISSEKECYYNKKHLFRMGDEGCCFTSGQEKLIVEHKGFNVCLLICYDLRFPVWSRNVDNEYDLLIYVASWPESRSSVWDILLKARAIENMSYVCGVNRIGRDGLNLLYKGGSVMVDARGNTITSIKDNEQAVETVELSLDGLTQLRQKFPVWKDADRFQILE